MMECPSLLRVSIILTKDLNVYENKDGSKKLLGLQGRFLSTVLEAMKMPFKISIAEDGEWGRVLPNGNWTGMIGMIQKGVADIAESGIAITEQRSTVVDFSTVYRTDDMTFVIKKPGPVPAYLAFVHPFDFTTWSFVLTALLVMPLIFKYFFYKENYIFIFLRLLGSIFRHSTLAKYDNNGFKSLIFAWWFFATILSFSYSALLLSMLSIPSEIIAVKNFQELAKAVKNNDYRCYVSKGTATLDFMLRSDKDYLKYLGESAFLHSWYSTNQPLLLRDQIGYRSAVIDLRNNLKLVAGPEEWKPHFLSDDSVTTYKFAIPMKKNFCFKKKLNTIISRVNSAGLYWHFKEEDDFKSWLSASERRKNISKKIKPLSLKDLFGAFGVLLVGLILGIIAFICEVICQGIKKKHV